MSDETQIFGPDRPNARRAAAFRLETARLALEETRNPVVPGTGVDPASAHYAMMLADYRAAQAAYAPYWAG